MVQLYTFWQKSVHSVVCNKNTQLNQNSFSYIFEVPSRSQVFLDVNFLLNAGMLKGNGILKFKLTFHDSLALSRKMRQSTVHLHRPDIEVPEKIRKQKRQRNEKVSSQYNFTIHQNVLFIIRVNRNVIILILEFCSHISLQEWWLFSKLVHQS